MEIARELSDYSYEDFPAAEAKKFSRNILYL